VEWALVPSFVPTIAEHFANFLRARAYFSTDEIHGGRAMSAKWNWAIDNTAVRMTANLLAFGVWLATAVAIMEVAARG
jgi:hypothetical protein